MILVRQGGMDEQIERGRMFQNVNADINQHRAWIKYTVSKRICYLLVFPML